ncbi:carcinoembryonic antigen-related cell adhesion molecule 3-like [Hypanus sabinus]|uniref:carcinoembryonic antigen-related cell adhesion molecule 3-like n=1 Tax=Hypanus sabinus TaxID=79690 RepID=UPI0028C48413|nr:carcinoembryonic antigen-related cell adhesion molecule 3-like [Hypanus sabinus]
MLDQGRVHLYPDNGSLLLWDLRSSDSGVYVITVYCGGNNTVRDNVSLTVHNGAVYGSLATVSVRGREVNGIVGQSALLPGSCCTPTLCSLQQIPPPFITPSHKGRVHLYPDNGSLLLWDLRSSDSGVYVITVYCGGNNTVRDNVSLTVHNGAVYGSLATVSVRGREVNGIVGQSALLPGSCCTPTLCSLQQVEWYLYPGQIPLVQLTRQCSPLPDGPGCNCSDPPPFITPSHKGRVHLYPDNGSLLLWDLRSNDSGVYVITVYCGGNNTVRDNVSLTVHNGAEKANSTSSTTNGQLMTTAKDWRLFHLYRAALFFLVIILFVISLVLSMTRKQMGNTRTFHKISLTSCYMLTSDLGARSRGLMTDCFSTSQRSDLED